MTKEILTDAVLREFLLGKVDDEENARIESLFLTDSETREKVLVIEQELMEDYLEGSLTAEDKAKFLLRYGQTAAQLQQLRITKAIKDWAIRENASQTVLPAPSTWERLCTVFRLRPMFVVPIAAAALIAIIVAGIWVNTRLNRNAIGRELAELNTPANLREVRQHMISLDLPHIALRSVEQRTELKKTADVQIVELRLPWIQKQRYPTYRAEVRRVSGGESFTIPNLQAENDELSTIRLRLPTRILDRGQYQVRLSGIADNNVPGLTEEYSFTVSS